MWSPFTCTFHQVELHSRRDHGSTDANRGPSERQRRRNDRRHESGDFSWLPKLPPELRIKIWKAACLPRTDKDHGLHYVTIDTVTEDFDWDTEEGYSVTMDRNLEGYIDEFDVENDFTGYITLRAMRRPRKRVVNVQNTANEPKESAYLWDAGLWTTCKESRDVTIEHVDLNGWLKLREEPLDDLDEFSRQWCYKNFPSTMVPHKKDKTWRPMVIPRTDIFCIAAGRLGALPRTLYGMKMLAPFLGTRSFTIVEGWNIAFKFHESWNIDFPRDIGKLQRENSQRGLLATWVEMFEDDDTFNPPGLWIIDDTVGWVTLPGSNTDTVFRDCGGDYVPIDWSATRGDSASGGIGAVRQFITPLGT